MSIFRGGLDDALGDLVAAGDAAEDVEEDRAHLLVGGDHLERVDDRVGLGAAARVEEVGGVASGLGDDVQGGHAESGAVAEDADVAVELDVGEPLLLRHPLLRVLDEALLEVGEVLVAVEGGVVDRHLGVEGDHVAVLGDDQRVDLDQGGVALVEGVVELDHHLRRLLAGILVDAGVGGQGARLRLAEALVRLDVPPHERVGVLLGDLLDVHAAHRREHRQQLLGGAVEDDRGVVLGVDLRGVLDPDLVDGEGPLAVRAADVHAEDRVGVLGRLFAVLRDLDAAGLAAAADLDLSLDDARVADLLGRLHGGLDGVGDSSFWDGNPMPGEQLLSLVFEEVHGPREVIRAQIAIIPRLSWPFRSSKTSSG